MFKENKINRHRHEFILWSAFIIYILAWSFITVWRFYSLHAYVYDAGLFMQELYDVSFVHWTLTSFFLSFTLRGFKFIIFPIALFKSFPLLFVFQTTWIATGSLFLYYIADAKKIGKTESLMIALSYLVFFPLAGANFFDIHNLTFFPSLFLAAYYCLIKGRTYSTIALYFLASVTKYPMSLVVALFVFILIVENYLSFRGKNIRKDREKANLYFIILIISLIVFLSRYIFFLISYHFVLVGDAHIFGFFGPKISNYDVLISILLLFGPVLFLPMLSIRTLPFSLGYLALAFFSRFWGYVAYPYGLTTIYIYQLSPFLMLGVIEVISGNSILNYAHNLKRKKHIVSKFNTLKQLVRKMAFYQKTTIYAIFVIILFLALFFQPYGPFNGVNPEYSFNLKQATSVNMTEYNAVLRLVKSVPSNDPYVVVQNGLPEFFPRYFNLSGNPMNTPGILEVPGIAGGLSYNLTYLTLNGTWQKLRIDYVIADPYQSTYYEALSSPYNLSMSDLVKQLYQSGNYGIFAEIGGMIVLKHNFTGSPAYYTPFDYYARGDSLISSFISNGNVTIHNVHTTNGEWLQVWRTPTIPMSPGEYEVNITYAYQNPTENQSIYKVIISLSGNPINYETSYYLTPANLGTVDTTHVMHFYVNILNFTDSFKIFAQIPPHNSWDGLFNISKVTIRQTGALLPKSDISSIFDWNLFKSGFISTGNVTIHNVHTTNGE